MGESAASLVFVFPLMIDCCQSGYFAFFFSPFLASFAPGPSSQPVLGGVVEEYEAALDGDFAAFRHYFSSFVVSH